MTSSQWFFLTFLPLRASCETEEDFENLDSGIHPEVSHSFLHLNSIVFFFHSFFVCLPEAGGYHGATPRLDPPKAPRLEGIMYHTLKRKKPDTPKKTRHIASNQKSLFIAYHIISCQIIFRISYVMFDIFHM